MTAPTCGTCRVKARLTNGAEVYPHRRDLHGKPIWVCDGCGGRVGCHPGTTTPLGTPAGPALRRARSMLHDERIDPLWKQAHMALCYSSDGPIHDERRIKKIQQKARGRVYTFLAKRMGIASQNCHTGMFSIEQCRQAWSALDGVTYMDIRKWAHENLEPAT